jgi:hypothetical protein
MVKEEVSRTREDALKNNFRFEEMEVLSGKTLQLAGFDLENEDAFLGGGEKLLSLFPGIWTECPFVA